MGFSLLFFRLLKLLESLSILGPLTELVEFRKDIELNNQEKLYALDWLCGLLEAVFLVVVVIPGVLYITYQLCVGKGDESLEKSKSKPRRLWEIPACDFSPVS